MFSFPSNELFEGVKKSLENLQKGLNSKIEGSQQRQYKGQYNKRQGRGNPSHIIGDSRGNSSRHHPYKPDYKERGNPSHIIGDRRGNSFQEDHSKDRGDPSHIIGDRRATSSKDDGSGPVTKADLLNQLKEEEERVDKACRRSRIASEREKDAKLQLVKADKDILQLKEENQQLDYLLRKQSEETEELKVALDAANKTISSLKRSPLTREKGPTVDQINREIDDTLQRLETKNRPVPPTEQVMDSEETGKIYDAHFHLDRLCKRIKQPISTAILGEKPKPIPGLKLPVGGGIAVFCDPGSFPSDELIREIHNLPGYFGIAVGIHPSHSTLNERGMWEATQKIQKLIENNKLDALGEIGFDWCKGGSIGKQEQLVHSILKLSQVDTPIVLHVRGGKKDTHSERAYDHCLKFLKDRVPEQQSIQLHCCTGNKETIKSWSQSFPNAFFSYGGLSATFDESQKEGLRLVTSERILLETDSPYLPLNRGTVNRPQFIGDISRIIAQIRGESSEVILKRNANNFLKLFNFSNADTLSLPSELKQVDH